MTSYLEKHALFPSQIVENPELDLNLVVVIPCYDEPDLIKSLQSLKNCDPPYCGVEVIIVFNDSETDNESVKLKNNEGFNAANGWGQENSRLNLKFHFLYHSNLPAKRAGVGLARKIGMDEAVYRLEKVNRSNGIIACFDADSLCQPNYLQALERHFTEHSDTQACSIYFEHPIDGSEYEPEVYEAIILYELHLRYYNNAKRFTGFPFAFETIGSSMAVRSDAYQRQGGMNRRKAGEDFYFLNKFIPLGNYSEIKTTTIIPSPRKSYRVPFGTGKAVADLIEKQEIFSTYAPQTFFDLKTFFDVVPNLFSLSEGSIVDLISTLPMSVQTFLEKQDFIGKIAEIKGNTTNLKTFYNRFYRWFNGFLMMKFVHHSRDEFYENVPVEKAAGWLLNVYFNYELPERQNAKDLLLYFRKEDKK